MDEPEGFENDPEDAEPRASQEEKGYGEDEGEREAALEEDGE